MTGDCRDERFQTMLHHYELGMLSEQERQEFEIHLLECESCYRKAQELKHVARLMKVDQDIRAVVQEAVVLHSEAKEGMDVVGLDRPATRRITVVRRAFLAAAAVLVLLLLKPWQLEFHPDQEAVAAENRLVITDFVGASNDSADVRTGEMIANLLVADLSESHYVQVVSSQYLKDLKRLIERSEISSRDGGLSFELARRARARWLLTGSVLQTTPEFIVSAHLVEVASGTVVFSRTAQVPSEEELFAVVDSLSASVKARLPLPMTAAGETDRPVAEVTTSSREAFAHFMQGVENHSRLYYREAAESFKKAVELDSTFAMAYYYLARLEGRRYLEPALKYSDKASRRERYYIRSLEASAAGDRVRAMAILLDLVREYPDEKQAYYLLGIYNYHLYHLEAAAQYCQKAVKIDPLYKTAYNQLVYIYDELGQYEKALAAINRYIDLVPEEANPYDTRGTLYASHGNLDKAIASYQKALEIKPDFSGSQWNLGYAYLYKRDYTQAQTWFENLALSGSALSRSQARFYLSLIPIAKGRFDAALTMLEGYILEDVSSENSRAEALKRFLKCRILSQQGKAPEFLEEYRRYEAAYNAGYGLTTPGSRQYQVQMLAEMGYFDEAEQLCAQLKSDFEETVHGLTAYWYGRGVIDLFEGNPDLAIPSLEKATRATTDFPVHFMLGRAYLEAGRLGDAVDKFQEQLATYTVWRICWGISDVKLHYYLGQAYELSAWHDRAIEQYEIFLEFWTEADPGTPEVVDARQRLTRLKNSS